MGKLKTSIIPKKYVFIQATEPTDKSEGKLWYNTTDKTTYASDGISYSKVANVDLTTVYKMIGNNALNIIDNTAQANLTAGTNANIIRDTYSVAGGFLGSIDDGTSWTQQTLTNVISNIYHYGIKFNLKQPNFLKSATFSFGTTPATTWQLGTGATGNDDIGSGTLNNGVANINIMLQPNIDYYLTCYNNGSSYDYNTIGATYPYPIGDIGEIISDSHNSTIKLRAVQSLEFSGTNAIFYDGKYSNVDNYGIVTNKNDGLNTKTAKSGVNITIGNNDISIIGFKASFINATIGYLLDNSGNIIISANLDKNGNCYFPNSEILLANVSYQIAVDKGGLQYTATGDTSQSTYPINFNDFSIISSFGGGGTWLTTLQCLYSSANDAIAQTKNIKIDGTKKKAMIISTDEETTESGSINYDISTDRGINFLKNNLSGTEINLTNNGTNLILRQNLNGVGVGNTSTAKDYAVVLY